MCSGSLGWHTRRERSLGTPTNPVEDNEKWRCRSACAPRARNISPGGLLSHSISTHFRPRPGAHGLASALQAPTPSPAQLGRSTRVEKGDTGERGACQTKKAHPDHLVRWAARGAQFRPSSRLCSSSCQHPDVPHPSRSHSSVGATSPYASCNVFDAVRGWHAQWRESADAESHYQVDASENATVLQRFYVGWYGEIGRTIDDIRVYSQD